MMPIVVKYTRVVIEWLTDQIASTEDTHSRYCLYYISHQNVPMSHTYRTLCTMEGDHFMTVDFARMDNTGLHQDLDFLYRNATPESMPGVLPSGQCAASIHVRCLNLPDDV